MYSNTWVGPLLQCRWDEDKDFLKLWLDFRLSFPPKRRERWDGLLTHPGVARSEGAVVRGEQGWDKVLSFWREVPGQCSLLHPSPHQNHHQNHIEWACSFSGSLNCLEFCNPPPPLPLSFAIWNTINNLENLFTITASFSPYPFLHFTLLKIIGLGSGRGKDKI